MTTRSTDSQPPFPSGDTTSQTVTSLGLIRALSGAGGNVCHQAEKSPRMACRQARGLRCPRVGPARVGTAPGFPREPQSGVLFCFQGDCWIFASTPFLSCARRTHPVPGTSDAFFSILKTALRESYCHYQFAASKMGAERVRHLPQVTQPGTDAVSEFRPEPPDSFPHDTPSTP